MTAKSGDEARQRGHNHSSYDSGMCQKYVRGPCWDVGSLYGSAIEAWNGAREKHPGDRTPPDGAPVYYKGGQYGHAVLWCGAGHTGIRSTDCQSGGKVSDADLDWPVRNWGYTYLGWTGDINGVDLPLGNEDDMPLNQADKDSIRNIVRDEIEKCVGDVVTVPKDDPNYDPDNPTIWVKNALQWLLGRST